MSTRPHYDLQAWSDSVDGVQQKLAVDSTQGLEEHEALRRRSAVGPNQLRVAKQRHFVSILIDQFKSIVVVLLLAAGVVALLFSNLAEAIAIFAVLLLNATIGFLTEWRATRSMEELRRFARVTCVLLRAGRVRSAAAEELVPGDIVLLEAGDLVPADLRMVQVEKLCANESVLTGESLPAHKQTDPLPEDTVMLDRNNLAFKGTAITRGKGRGVVVATGMRTEFGKIFEQVSESEAERTPLEKRLDSLGGNLAWAVIVIGALIAIGGILSGRDTVLAIEVAIALSVAAIPEGLPIVATIALARGMWRMAKRNALITRLSAVETLGATSVILTDKTGTLTENRMAATTALLAEADIDLEASVDPLLTETLRELLITAALCNNAIMQRDADSKSDGVGDPTEVALLAAASQYDIWREELVAQEPEVSEEPFDPDSKRMATVHKRRSDYKVAVKGAPEVILASCYAVHTSGGVIPLDNEARQSWLGRVEHLCARGLRTIALADKAADAVDIDPYDNLILHGVVGLEDPPREGVENAIRRYREAGVLVVMVTGDHAETARNIASQIGIVDESADTRQFLGGEAVDQLLEEKRFDELTAVRVFSRVTPEQKLKLISLYQQQNHVVAMTGDGVNDAPALKKADIGVAMGIRGTPVAKEAADMVLQDDDFGTIVSAIGHGRAIFENIRKFVVYLMSCNASEVLVVALATIAGAPLPLLPLQILFLNLVTDVFPALALGVGPGRTYLMKKKPRPSSERILMRRHWVEIGVYGVVMALTVLSAMALVIFYLGFDQGRAVTVAFCTLALAQLWHVFNMRGNLRQVINNEITGNIWIWLALALCILLILAAVYAPVFREVLRLSDPGIVGWLVIVIASLVPLIAAPFVRWIANRHAVKAAR